MAIILACFIGVGLIGESAERWWYVHASFPFVIKPEIEHIPGVVVDDVKDGGYEDLVYTTLIIDGEWKMWLNVSTDPDFVTDGKFRVETVAGCWVGNDGFANLAEAVDYYRQHPELRQCK